MLHLKSIEKRVAKGEETVGTRAGLHDLCTPCYVGNGGVYRLCCEFETAVCFTTVQRLSSDCPATVQRRVQGIRNSSGRPGWAAPLFLHPRQQLYGEVSRREISRKSDKRSRG